MTPDRTVHERATYVCVPCTAGWQENWSEAPTISCCPHCGGLAPRRGAVIVVSSIPKTKS